MSQAPSSVHITQDIGGITVTVPRRASALARHLLDKLGQLALVALMFGFVALRLVGGVLSFVLIVLIVVLAWAAKRYRDHLVDGKRQQLRITPQRVIFPEGEVILEDIEALRLDLDRGQFQLHTNDKQVFCVLGELDYAELLWLREFLTQHIAQRREKLGDALGQPAAVPDALQALRER